MEKLVERFIRYAKVNTQSNENVKTCPSSPGQIQLAQILVSELQDLGMSEVSMDGNGYVMATLPANTVKTVPVIGFISHLDTSPDFKSERVNPQIVDHVGKSIVLNARENIILSPVDFPVINNYLGQQIITTDGTTLLGADNKAGIAEIITAMDYLLHHPGDQAWTCTHLLHT